MSRRYYTGQPATPASSWLQTYIWSTVWQQKGLGHAIGLGGLGESPGGRRRVCGILCEGEIVIDGRLGSGIGVEAVRQESRGSGWPRHWCRRFGRVCGILRE